MGTRRRPTVLLIDEDPDVLKVMEYVFAEEDLDLLTCRTPDEGLCVLADQRVDCVLLDVPFTRTPECLGLLGALKSLPGVAQVPVLATSAMNEPEVAQRALALGARKFILKPFYPADILRELRAVLH